MGLLCTPAFADDDLEQDLQMWLPVTLRTPLSPHGKIQGFFEAQPRLGDDIKHVNVLIVRPAIGYQVNKHLSIWQGYAWQPTLQPTFRNENRIFQQVLLENKIKKLSVTNRTRLEQRWIEDAAGTAVRARHQLRLAYPLIKSEKLSAVVSEEYFVNFNTVTNGPHSGFDQNRAFAGLNYKLAKHVSAEAGYLGQFINRHNAPDRWNHIIQLSLSFNLN